MPHMIRMSVERLSCFTLRLSNTLFINVLKLDNHGVRCYKTSSREQIIQIKYKALKELEKETLRKDVTSFFGVLKNTLSTWKKNKDKIFEKHEQRPYFEKSKIREVYRGTTLCINGSFF